MPLRARRLDQEIPSILIKDCAVIGGRAGVVLNGVEGAVIDGLYTKNVKYPIIDTKRRKNTYRNIMAEYSPAS